MLTRRRFLPLPAIAPAVLGRSRLLAQTAARGRPPLRLAILGNSYTYGSDLQIAADRFLVGYAHEGDWHMPNVQVVSMYVEERGTVGPDGSAGPRPRVAQSAYPGLAPGRRGAPAATATERASMSSGDLSEARAREFGFRFCANIPEALRCGGDQLAVDAVLAVVGQEGYPRDHRGRILSPRYDYFQQCLQVFQDDKRAVPYFNHGSLAFSFRDARNMVAAAEKLNFPLLAGSPLAVTWRLPDTDVPAGAQVQEAVAVCPFAGMEFDALEAMQSMLERRKGGETGVKAVQLLDGDDVWAAGESGRWSRELLSSALSRSDAPQGLTLLDGRPQDMANSGVLPQLVKDPAAYCIEYVDGTRATLLVLEGADQDFTFSARVAGHGLVATQFFRSPFPNVAYSAAHAAKAEQLFVTGAAPFSVRRTLLTGGILEAGLDSRARMNQRLETPQLAVSYQPPAASQYART